MRTSGPSGSPAKAANRSATVRSTSLPPCSTSHPAEVSGALEVWAEAQEKATTRENTARTCVAISPRRFDQTPIWRALIWTNPLFIALFCKTRSVWTEWYQNRAVAPSSQGEANWLRGNWLRKEKGALLSGIVFAAHGLMFRPPFEPYSVTFRFPRRGLFLNSGRLKSEPHHDLQRSRAAALKYRGQAAAGAAGPEHEIQHRIRL